MKKSELTKKQQEKFSWLMKANTEYEDVIISDFDYLIWKDGIWEDGLMWSNLQQKHLKVEWNGKTFEEDLKDE